MCTCEKILIAQLISLQPWRQKLYEDINFNTLLDKQIDFNGTAEIVHFQNFLHTSEGGRTLW